MRRGYIFGCLCDNVLKLFEWGISGFYRIFSLYCMPSRIVLRSHGTERSVGLLRCGLLLRRFLDGLLELCIWNIHIFGIFERLHLLSHWDLSEHNWCHSMLSVSCGIVLRHHGTECTDGRLRCGHIFRSLSDSLF